MRSMSIKSFTLYSYNQALGTIFKLIFFKKNILRSKIERLLIADLSTIFENRRLRQVYPNSRSSGATLNYESVMFLPNSDTLQLTTQKLKTGQMFSLEKLLNFVTLSVLHLSIFILPLVVRHTLHVIRHSVNQSFIHLVFQSFSH